MDINIWQYLFMWKDIFKDKILKISLETSINTWTFAINTNDTSTNFEPQLSQKLSPKE